MDVAVRCVLDGSIHSSSLLEPDYEWYPRDGNRLAVARRLDGRAVPNVSSSSRRLGLSHDAGRNQIRDASLGIPELGQHRRAVGPEERPGATIGDGRCREPKEGARELEPPEDRMLLRRDGAGGEEVGVREDLVEVEAGSRGYAGCGQTRQCLGTRG